MVVIVNYVNNFVQTWLLCFNLPFVTKTSSFWNKLDGYLRFENLTWIQNKSPSLQCYTLHLGYLPNIFIGV